MCFSDVPGLTTRVEHVVQLTLEFKPKRMRAYKIPERLQPEVERQLDEMLNNGIIRESNSPMSSPLVCVLKAKGGFNGIRIQICQPVYSIGRFPHSGYGGSYPKGGSKALATIRPPLGSRISG